MGPSGAGKTTLISSLTLDALYGHATGKVTLNGVSLTDEIFKSHCYVVKQHDKHWPYLTCRETLSYAAELYDVVDKADKDALVNEIIQKMGMESNADVRNSQLSGGQRRRLSIGVALLKQPTLLFLDEPTSGLDAAAASSIMQEIVRVAKEERIIVVCTIHQPSTKVYNGFDQLMVMSRGRMAYSGDVKDAVQYFAGIGYECPPAMNPAEFFLDLVNSDFTDEAAVTAILDTWEEKRPDGGSSSHHKKGFEGDDGQEGVTTIQKAPLRKEIAIMFSRHWSLIMRDPVLYMGRCVIFLFMCMVFALVYLNARDFVQEQALNKFWVMIWFIGVPSNMGVVAVYALNDEFKSILREAKNGMVTPLSYVLAKTILVLPWFLIFALFAHGLPLYVVQDVPGEAFFLQLILYAAVMFVFESVAETLSVWCEDPVRGRTPGTFFTLPWAFGFCLTCCCYCGWTLFLFFFAVI
jgi:ABC-type multidrug transport system ATPase subunit